MTFLAVGFFNLHMVCDFPCLEMGDGVGGGGGWGEAPVNIPI